MTTPSMSQKWRIQGKKLTTAWWFVPNERIQQIQECSLLLNSFKHFQNKVKVLKDSSLWKFVSEGKAEEQRLAGWGQLHPRAGWPGDRVRPGASQHRGRHSQDGADYQEYPGAAASGSGEQARQVSHVSKGSSSFLPPAAPALFWADGRSSALCSSACIAHCFSNMLCRLHPWPSLFPAAMTRPCATVSPPHPPLPPHRWNRPCERSEGVRRLRHSLGCFSTLVPWAEKAPTPLQPLGLRSPDPASWYSGLCPCLPGTVFFSSLSQSVRLTLLAFLLYFANKSAVRCAVFWTPHLYSSVTHFVATTRNSAKLHLCTALTSWDSVFDVIHLQVGCCSCGVAQLSTYNADLKKKGAWSKLTWKQRC